MSEPADEAAELQAFPPWRQAVRDFLAEGFAPGQIVRHDWLEAHFGLEPLAADATLSVQQHKDRQLRWLQSVEAFKTELLEGHQIFLASVHGEGYRVTPPGEQTSVTTDKFENDARRAFRNAALRLRNVRHSELTDAQRRENLDAIAKLSMVRGMVKSITE